MISVDQAALDRTVSYLRQELPGLQAVILFGTAASGAMRADSDIDLAFDSDPALLPSRRFDLALRCADLMGRDVDLVDLRRAPLPLQAQILGEGRKLYVAVPVALAFYENTILARYCAYNEERRPLVEVMVRRGFIHGHS